MARQAPPFERPDDTPEFYADAANVETQYYGTTLHFGEARPDAPQLVKATIKMSPQLAKVLSLILSSHVRQYEEGVGPITVPKQLLHDLGLEDLI